MLAVVVARGFSNGGRERGRLRRETRALPSSRSETDGEISLLFMDLSAALSAHTAALGALYGAYSTSAPSLCATAASALAEQITQLLTTQLAQAQTLLDHASQELQGKTTKLREWEHALERPSTVLGNGTLLDQLAHTDALLASLEADITSRTASLRALDLELSQLHAKLALPPPTPSTDLSLSSLASLKAQLATAKATLQDRTLLIIQHQSEIAQLSNELGAPLLPSSPSPTEASLAALVLERQSLETLKSSRNIKIQETYDALHPLWTVLSVPESEMESFVELHMGSTLAVLNAYTSELSRMLELKRSNLASFILRERETIKQLWDRMYYSEKMRGLSFPPFEVQVEPTFVYNAATGVPDAIPSPFISEELLAQHEAHRTTLLVELERAGEVLVKVEKYFSVVQEKEELEAASHDPSRLKSTRGDPGRLLREEKARKRVGKEGPKVRLCSRSCAVLTRFSWSKNYYTSYRFGRRPTRVHSLSKGVVSWNFCQKRWSETMQVVRYVPPPFLQPN